VGWGFVGKYAKQIAVSKKKMTEKGRVVMDTETVPEYWSGRELGDMKRGSPTADEGKLPGNLKTLGAKQKRPKLERTEVTSADRQPPSHTKGGGEEEIRDLVARNEDLVHALTKGAAQEKKYNDVLRRMHAKAESMVDALNRQLQMLLATNQKDTYNQMMEEQERHFPGFQSIKSFVIEEQTAMWE
jgi:hypothetical protein